ncbi:MAG: hypothetical protein KC478_09185 [Bacteriovoracaceae bacterium]|nr:hypothetical protein [Bacteriovoracaceae bacterium]
MKNATSVENENVIKVAFGETPNEIAHPASKNFPEEVDLDPLEELLAEGGFEELFEEDVQEEDYIHAHSRPWDFSSSFQDDALDLAANIQKQIKRLKEDSKRIKYYLDELNID